MIYLLALLTAFASFLHEVGLSQALSASLGGTILRYHTGFGLFTCFLGLGAWAFDVLKHRMHARRMLIGAQIFMIFAGLAGPYFIIKVNPLSYPPDYEFLLTGLSYLPLVAVAFVSGLELPALISLAQRKEGEFNVLGWDYLGMVGASLLFPLVLLYAVGVQGTLWIAALCSAAALLLSLKFVAKASPATSAADHRQTKTSTRLPGPVIGAMIFLFSFCSMSYELLTAKAISDLILDEVLAHSAAIGLFLLGLGVGTFAATRFRRPQISLVYIELCLTAIALFALPLMYLLAIWWTTTLSVSELTRATAWSLTLLAPIPWLIGFISGFELPLLLRCWPNQKSFGFALSLSYAGALIAGFLVPLLLLPSLGLGAAFTLTAILNLLGAGILFLGLPIKHLVRGGILFLILGLLTPLSRDLSRSLEQLFLKAHYFELRLDRYDLSSLRAFRATSNQIGDIQRFTSGYQFLDLIGSEPGGGLFPRDGFSLFINRQPQFRSDSWRTYHESMVQGAINLSGQPLKEVLILGGGDGLLASMILADPAVTKVTLVEIDPRVVELAKTTPEWRALHRDVFSDPRLELVVDDAFHFLGRTKKKFSSVFIDFPYPNSFEVSRVFSVEFYRLLAAALSDDGYIMMDAPIWFDLDDVDEEQNSHKVLFNTLEAAGFKTLFAFGPIEPFLYATLKSEAPAFDYPRLQADLPNRTFVNMKSLDYLVLPFKKDSNLVNSIYHPKRFLN